MNGLNVSGAGGSGGPDKGNKPVGTNNSLTSDSESRKLPEATPLESTVMRNILKNPPAFSAQAIREKITPRALALERLAKENILTTDEKKE